jgi:hypothetical protein
MANLQLINRQHGPAIQLTPESAESVWSVIGGAPFTSEMVESVEQIMLAMPQRDCPVIHRFGPNLYIREVNIPADTFAIGHHQNFEQMNVFLTGLVTMFKDDGSIEEMRAPMCFVGPPGKKIGYIHEDTTWLNIFSTSETDIDALEKIFFTKDKTWNSHLDAKHFKGQIAHAVDRNDFTKMLAEFGVTAEYVRAQSEIESNQIPMPMGNYKMKVSKSPIEGRGVFATASIVEGEIIAPAKVDEKRTPAGRYTNHAKAPNARMTIANSRGDINLVALRDIHGCQGGQDGEEITIDYRQSVNEVMKTFHKDFPCQQ